MTLEPPEFWTRDPGTFRRKTRVDVYETARLVLRDLRPGAWLISGIPCDSQAAVDLEAGGGIIAWYGEGADRAVILSGRVEHVVEEESVTDAHAGIVACTHEAGGRDDLSWVTDRVAHPVPATLNFATAATDTYSGAGETAMKALVNDHAGPGAHSTRRVAGLTVAADQARGLSISDEVRLDPLEELLAGWAIRAGVLPRVVAENGGLVFDVYEGTDRSDELVFAVARSNVTRVKRTEAAPTGNFVWVGGQGEGTARTFVSDQDAASQARWGFRRETFRDRRDTNDLTILAEQADEELQSKAEQRSVLVVPLDSPNLRYGADYALGDLVTTRTRNGAKIVQQIREVQIVCNPAEVVRFEPLVADPLVPTPGGLSLFGDVRDLASRTVNLESR